MLYDYLQSASELVETCEEFYLCADTLLFLPHSKSLTGLFTILDKITLHSSYKTDLLLRYLLQGNTLCVNQFVASTSPPRPPRQALSIWTQED